MAPASVPPPGFARRLACLIYEGVLLFGVVTIAAYLYSSLTQQKHALIGTDGLRAFLFVVIGIYFTWFWSAGRQTLAMKTWHLRLMTKDGQPLTQARALARYVASWLWFLPALAVASLGGWRSGGAVALALVIGVAVYALVARLTPSRQYLHDLICGTRMETWRAPRPGQNPAP
ncbi:MAG: RDD family protein [Rubrivivax sp.]